MGPAAQPADATTRSSRRYDSTLRHRVAAGNRRTLLEVATRMFAERGWTVGVRDIAREAGMSVETLYANFGSKAELLHQVLDVAVVGDDEPVALADRPEFQALGVGDAEQRAAAAAALATAIYRRTCGLHRALREAAAADAELAARLEAARGRQRETVRDAGAMVAGRDLDRAEAEGLWAVLSTDVYELLTASAGWSPGDYEEWAAVAITRFLQL